MSRRSVHRPPHPAAHLAALGADLREELPDAMAESGMGGFLWELSTGLVSLDAGGLSLFGLDPDEYDGTTAMLGRHMVRDELPALRALAEEALEQGHDSYGSYFRVHAAGGTRWISFRGLVRRDATGTARRVVGVVRDATTEFQQLTDQAHLEADRERQADIVQATTSVLSRALTVDDVRRALEDHRILGPLGAVGISLSMLEQGRLRRFPSPTMAPEAFLDLEYTRLDDQLPASEAVRTQVPLFVTRYEVRDNYPRMWPYIKDTVVSSGAVLPLFAQARPVGALVILYETKDTFTPEERNLFVVLAATVGQSLQRAVLYDEEHAVAVGLQQAMLPARIPAVPGVQVAVRYRPAGNGHQIGGDWYDVVPLPDGHVGLVVGDVEGHDIHASVVMGQLRTALRAYASEGHSPGTLMARASMFLHDLDTDRFATCLYADLDPVSGRVRFVRAGHHDPLIGHPDGSSSRPGLAGGLPLGLPQFDSTPYPVTDLRLDRDDTLLFCTDGLIEYDGNDIEDGMREIEALLPDGPDDTESLAEYLVKSVEARHQQQDDIALLLVRLDPAGRKPG